jgi:hypothetical protein
MLRPGLRGLPMGINAAKARDLGTSRSSSRIRLQRPMVELKGRMIADISA